VRIKPTLILFPLLILALLLGSCGPKETPVPTATPTVTPTITPTATPTIPLVILVVPADMEQTASNLYQTTVYDLAQAAGYRFQVRNTLTAADLEPSLKIVVILPPDPGLLALAAAAPQAQFLAVNIPGVTAGGNVSVIGNQNRPDLVGFLFGYISAMITAEYDYRIGMILPQGDPSAQAAFAAFKNGMTYYCGLCPKFYYYFDIYGNALDYPQSVEIPADEKVEYYPAYGNVLSDKKVAMAYIYPTIATPELLAQLGNLGIITIGDVTPTPRPLYWVASLQPDVVKAIQTAWPDLLAGRGGITVQPPFALADVDSNILTPGKQKLAEEVLADLLNGRISTGIQP
jgi:hypothetical protein